MVGADDEEDDLQAEVSKNEIAAAPNEVADPQWLVDAKIPSDIRDHYEIFSYRGAAAIRHGVFKIEPEKWRLNTIA